MQKNSDKYDRDLAELYQIKTIALNQAVKRNAARFPESFRFQLTPSETDELITKCDRFQPLKHSPTTPYAFTEQGVAISHQLTLDFEKHNAQYAPIEVEQFDRAHDRFLCIDDTVYHVGASLKDLGKKWFGFNRMEWTTDELLNKI